ncbi:MAG: late competence development ComFB family protein [Gammaproteobacteria bacterium]|nr:late competence development ComFB family protein [Gammaproteobacteria bacterium]
MPSFSSIQNYYERLVFEFINDVLIDQYSDMDDDFFLDVACYGLTRLPSRYMRHEIDMAFYLAPGERTEMFNQVRDALLSAAEFIYTRRKKASKA